MKLVTEKPEKSKVSVTSLAEELQAIEKQLKVECKKCDGTGKPRTKNGEPPEKGHGDAKCADCKGTGDRGSRLENIENNIEKLRISISKIESQLRAHINRQTAEFRVLEKEEKKGVKKWGDYTGVFYLDSEDEKRVVLEKARKHYKTYFVDGVYHRDKNLGLFLTSGRGGKQLIEEMNTDD
jgi:hypothetical protein